MFRVLVYLIILQNQFRVCNVPIAFQGLQAVALILHRMAFCLSGKVVALHMDKSTAKVYVIKVVQ